MSNRQIVVLPNPHAESWRPLEDQLCTLRHPDDPNNKLSETVVLKHPTWERNAAKTATRNHKGVI